MAEGWRCAGVRWGDDGAPSLRWLRVAPGVPVRVVERESRLRDGEPLGFVVVGERRCLGVFRGGRWRVCPTRAVIAGGGTRATCEECAGLDRARSVAADTLADDPRPYRVYLAWFGPGLVKVGITGQARGPARLLEQGAVAFTWIGVGPLMAARRAEELLRVGLGVPDRISYERKRGARGDEAGPGERAEGLRSLHARACALPGWPESLERLPCAVVDHGELFGLPLRVTGVVAGLGDGVVVGGTLRGVAGPDLYLAGLAEAAGPVPASPGAGPTAASAPGLSAAPPPVVALDTRVLAGWTLASAGAAPSGGARPSGGTGGGSGRSVVRGGGGEVRALRGAAGDEPPQEGLF